MEHIINTNIDLTKHQLAIWLESKVYPNSAIHNIGTFVKLNGVPNEDILSQAIKNVIQENDALRLRISKKKMILTCITLRLLNAVIMWHTFTLSFTTFVQMVCHLL
jgi:hypothetical protein